MWETLAEITQWSFYMEKLTERLLLREFIMIPYVKDTSKWEDWQRDYRFGLILIMPPPEVSQEIDLLRAKYDPVPLSCLLRNPHLFVRSLEPGNDA